MVDRLMKHFKPEELMEYFDGSLDGRRVREHLSTCFQCRSRLKDLSLTRIMMAPPVSESPGDHVPSEILAQYVEDRLSILQSRAMEEHLGMCRRCLSDLVSLRTTMSDPLDQAPPETIAAYVKEHLDEYRRVTPLGELSSRKLEDEICLDFNPHPEPDDPKVYDEKVAKQRFPFKRGVDLRSRVEALEQKNRLKVSANRIDSFKRDMGSQPGDLRTAAMAGGPEGMAVSVDTATIFFSLDERGGNRFLSIQVRDLETIELLPDVKLTLTIRKEVPVVVTTGQSGTAVLKIPDGLSTLQIHLEKIYELDLRSLL